MNKSQRQQGHASFLAAASEASAYSQEQNLSPTSEIFLPSRQEPNHQISVPQQAENSMPFSRPNIRHSDSDAVVYTYQ